MSSEREKAQEAIALLSELIVVAGRDLGSEQHNPRGDADASDDFMEERTRRIKELREIRQRLEDLVMGVV